jgi:hypothetical protein
MPGPCRKRAQHNQYELQSKPALDHFGGIETLFKSVSCIIAESVRRRADCGAGGRGGGCYRKRAESRASTRSIYFAFRSYPKNYPRRCSVFRDPKVSQACATVGLSQSHSHYHTVGAGRENAGSLNIGPTFSRIFCRGPVIGSSRVAGRCLGPNLALDCQLSAG